MIQVVLPRMNGHRSHGVIVSSSAALFCLSAISTAALTVLLLHSCVCQKGDFCRLLKPQKSDQRPPRLQFGQFLPSSYIPPRRYGSFALLRMSSMLWRAYWIGHAADCW